MILPFEKNVPMIFYQNKAFPLGIIEGNMADKEALSKWYAHVCINCRFSLRESNKFAIEDEGFFFCDTGILKRQFIRLYKTSYARYHIDYSLMALDFLKQGFYITGSYNEQHIKTSKFYNKEYHKHDYLLVGYDEAKKYFKAVGYNKDLKYDYFDVSFEAYNLSLEDSPYLSVEIRILEFNKELEIVLEVPKIIKKLKYYLQAKNEVMKEETAYGIEAVAALKDYYADQLAQQKDLDIRYSRGFMEHKELMLRRLQVLNKYGYIENPEMVKDYEYVKKESIILQNLCLKNNMKKSDATSHSIIKTFDEIIQHENEILTDVLKELQRKIMQNTMQ